MTAELGRVLRRCRAERLDVIVLKGPVLAETVYPAPALRPVQRPRPAGAARRPAARWTPLLRDLGCARLADEHSWDFDIAWDGATLYEAPAGVRVDLHWALLTEPRFAWNEDAQHAVWERAAPLTVAGEPALGLGREDLVLHLATHLAVHHSLAGLLRYWDLALRPRPRGRHARLGRAPRARAARWRVRHALFFVLLGVRAVFGAPVPPAVLAALRPRGPRAALLAALVRAVDAGRLERLEYLVTLLLVDRGRDCSGALRRALWPPADWMRARYGLAAGSRPTLYLDPRAPPRRRAGRRGRRARRCCRPPLTRATPRGRRTTDAADDDRREPAQAAWLAEPETLWAPWRAAAERARRRAARRRARSR